MINIQPFLEKLDYLEEYISWSSNKPRVMAVDYTFNDYITAVNNGEVYVIVPNQYAGSSLMSRKVYTKGMKLYWKYIYFSVVS